MQTNPNLESIVIRAAVAGDREVFCQLVHTYYAEDHGVELNENFSRTTFQTLLQDTTKGQIILFEYEHKVAGYALIIPFWSNEYGGTLATIDELYVLPAARQRGIARYFFQWLKVAQPDAVGFQLEVQPHNHAALRLYQKLGFERDENVHLLISKMPF